MVDKYMKGYKTRARKFVKIGGFVRFFGDGRINGAIGRPYIFFLAVFGRVKESIQPKVKAMVLPDAAFFCLAQIS